MTRNEPVRPRIDDRHLAVLSSRLTERDRYLLRLIYEHRILTTDQVADVAFGSIRRAEVRLRELYRLRVLERFRPLREVGSAPYHWIVDQGGATVLAAERGVDAKELGWRRDKALAVAGSERLEHTVGANGFFTALIRSARRRPNCALGQWWSERRCIAELGTIVRPDGLGIWVEGGRSLEFALEYDRGTERLERVVGKLAGYRDLALVRGRQTVVLIVLQSARREAEVRKAAFHGFGDLVPTATTVIPRETDPSGAHWLELLRPDGRRPLIALGSG